MRVNIQELDLNRNNVSRLPPAILGSLPALRVLKVAHNHLTVMDDLYGLSGLTGLCSLEIHNNPISQIDHVIDAGITSSATVSWLACGKRCYTRMGLITKNIMHAICRHAR